VQVLFETEEGFFDGNAGKIKDRMQRALPQKLIAAICRVHNRSG
jgi:hypothetical protein